jgi:peptide/nickel transport system ATP-binding protein
MKNDSDKTLSDNPLLDINDLTVRFYTDDGVVHAVNGISLSLREGETLGLVGETGAGKTTAALSILGLVPSPPGKVESASILFEGQDLRKMKESEYRKVRGNKISMIFQDPMTSLNPTMTVTDQIAEAIRNHRNLTGPEARTEAVRMLELVRIPADRAFEYPHQFSGGMKQRVVIAIALACNPKLLIADEPTTALDVTIQAQVLELMKELKSKLNTAIIMITHDLGIVSEICDRVAIMYAGEIVESGSLEQIYDNPVHPYTNGLFGSLPDIEKDVEFLSPIEGMMPDPADLPSGCKFHPRCKYAKPVCSGQSPGNSEIEPGHFARCLICEGKLPGQEVEKYV